MYIGFREGGVAASRPVFAVLTAATTRQGKKGAQPHRLSGWNKDHTEDNAHEHPRGQTIPQSEESVWNHELGWLLSNPTFLARFRATTSLTGGAS